MQPSGSANEVNVCTANQSQDEGRWGICCFRREPRAWLSSYASLGRTSGVTFTTHQVRGCIQIGTRSQAAGVAERIVQLVMEAGIAQGGADTGHFRLGAADTGD